MKHVVASAKVNLKVIHSCVLTLKECVIGDKYLREAKVVEFSQDFVNSLFGVSGPIDQSFCKILVWRIVYHPGEETISDEQIIEEIGGEERAVISPNILLSFLANTPVTLKEFLAYLRDKNGEICVVCISGRLGDCGGWVLDVYRFGDPLGWDDSVYILSQDPLS